MKTLAKIFVGLALLAVLLGFAGVRYLDSWSSLPEPVVGDGLVELSPGMPLRVLASRLEAKKMVSSALFFNLWMKLSGDYPKFEAGTYLFKDALTPSEIRDKLKSGETYDPVLLQVIVPEGFTLKMLINRLATKNVAKFAELTKLVNDRPFIQSLGVDSISLEGFIYPATYSFTKRPTSVEFFQKSVKTFFDKLPPNYGQDLAKIGLNLKQAVTIASLIELETMQDQEKPMIAEVILSRLKNGEALGIDAAIIYGIPDYDGDLRWTDLKNAKNPYNTRVHRGLPPTPIGSVSTSSLTAILNPTKLGYYYYVVDSENRSHHVFSRTLAEHNHNVQKFLKSGSASSSAGQ
jgi:UPF0755 protein